MHDSTTPPLDTSVPGDVLERLAADAQTRSFGLGSTDKRDFVLHGYLLALEEVGRLLLGGAGKRESSS